MLPYGQVTKDHLKSLLGGDKDFLKMEKVSFINPPNWDEIGVKNLYAQVTGQDEMKKYFPDKWAKGSQCDKSYFFNVLNTIFPDQVKTVIDNANQ